MNVDGTSASEVPGPFVDGRVAPEAADVGFLDVIDPSSGEVCVRVTRGSAAAADAAVSSARRAFDDGRWNEAPVRRRIELLLRLADLIDLNAPALDALDAEEMGKPVSLRRADAAGAGHLLRFFAEAADKHAGDSYVSDRNSLVLGRRVPRGVVGAIVPWNFPTHAAVLKVGPALAAGNTVVLKPSELSTRSAVRLAGLALEAGVPEGVFNVTPGRGDTVGQAIGLHPDVDMLTFTGSTAVGKQMLRYAADSNLKLVVAECGGKSPQILFDDGVDPDVAADAVADLLLANQGQICSVGSRLIVQRSIHDRVLRRIAEGFASIRMGRALDPETTFGPLASARQRERVADFVEQARASGAEILWGGRPVGEIGFFFEPTLIAGAPPTHPIVRSEVFGPVLTIHPFDSEEDAIRLAEDTEYGLAAFVWTADLSRGLRMARRLSAATWINAAAPTSAGAGYAAAFEPARQSGVGVEGGVAGLQAYTRQQLVWINHS